MEALVEMPTDYLEAKMGMSDVIHGKLDFIEENKSMDEAHCGTDKIESEENNG